MNDRDITILIADDEALIRAGFRALIDASTGFTVVGEAGDGATAAAQAHVLRPDVVLMDIRMPAIDGLQATRMIVGDDAIRARVLIVTTFDQDPYVYEALRSGASGFVLKDTEPERLLDAITTVARGDALLAPGITRRLIADFVHRTPDLPRLPAELTDRERDVFEQVVRGRSNAEIAALLHVAVTTVKTHVGRLLDKFAARDRVQLVVIAYEHGFVAARDADLERPAARTGRGSEAQAATARVFRGPR